MYVHIMAVYAGIFNGRKVCVRRAMHTDYDDVMRIDTDVYAGLDYLPVTYHESLTDPAARAYLTEIDNKVVSYACYWVGGENRNMTLGTAGRMHPEYRHLGLNQTVTRIMKQDMKRTYPNLKYNLGVATYNEQMIKNTTDVNGRVLGVMNNIVCSLASPADLRPMHVAEDSSLIRVTKPSLQDTLGLLRNDKILAHLFPNGFIYMSDRWMVGTANYYEVSRLIRKVDVYVSGTLEGRDLALSNATIRQCPIGVAIFIAYAGCSDINIIKAHIINIVRHFAKMPGILNGGFWNFSNDARGTSGVPKVVIVMTFPTTIDKTPVIEFIKRTFHGQTIEDFYPQVGIYETPY